jgi:hypothetical protein
LVVASCFLRSLTANDLEGGYTATYAFGSSRITLNADGSFQQALSIGDRVMNHEGHWKFDEAARRVDLDEALVADDGYGNLRTGFESESSMAVDLPVESNWLGHIRLGPDEGAPYLKD